MDEAAPAFGVAKGAYVLAVPYSTYKHHAVIGALVVLERKQGTLTNFRLHEIGQKIPDDYEIAWLAIAITQPMI